MPVFLAVRRCDAVVHFEARGNLLNQKVGACAYEHRLGVGIAIFGQEEGIDVFFVLVPIFFDGLFGVDKAYEVEAYFFEGGHGYDFCHHQKAPKQLEWQKYQRPRAVCHGPKPIVKCAVVGDSSFVKVVDVNLELVVICCLHIVIITQDGELNKIQFV